VTPLGGDLQRVLLVGVWRTLADFGWFWVDVGWCLTASEGASEGIVRHWFWVVAGGVSAEDFGRYF